jgi:hypothetical protein
MDAMIAHEISPNRRAVLRLTLVFGFAKFGFIVIRESPYLVEVVVSLPWRE